MLTIEHMTMFVVKSINFQINGHVMDLSMEIRLASERKRIYNCMVCYPTECSHVVDRHQLKQGIPGSIPYRVIQKTLHI